MELSGSKPTFAWAARSAAHAVGGSTEPPTQWAALRAAHAEVGQRPLRSILVPGAGLEPARF